MKINGTSVTPTLSVEETSISTLLSLIISPHLCPPQAVRSMHFGIEAFQGCIAVTATLRDENVMLGVGWLLCQPSDAFDHVSSPLFDRALVIVNPSHILKSV
jgi:hypothetical protein